MKIEDKIAEIIGEVVSDWLHGDRRIVPESERVAQIKALFPDGLFELLDKLKCPDCEGVGTREEGPFIPEYPPKKCPTCKGTGLDPNREIVVIDRKAELPGKGFIEPREEGIAEASECADTLSRWKKEIQIYRIAQQDMKGYVKEVKKEL